MKPIGQPWWILLAGLAACGPDPETDAPVCTAEERPGMDVEVGDAHTGLYITPIATVIAREGAYADTLRPHRRLPESAGRDPAQDPGPASLAGVHERAGTYRVEASAPGYRSAVRTVVVTRGECHVGTQRILMELQKHGSASP